jgi:hypothetical protein
MVLMLSDEFYFIYKRLNSPKDAEMLHDRMDLPFDMLFNVLAKKITRDTTRNFYKIKANSAHYLKEWKKGESFAKIAKRENFPAVLMATFILEKAGVSKKRIKEMVKNPEVSTDKRVERELKEAEEEDFVYSPKSSEHQQKNGKRSEGGIKEWLDERGIKYMTEYENRELEHHRRTPDFLLEKPLLWNGKKLNWIESKASFGDEAEIKRDYKKQLSDYVKFFGYGAVVYWYGYVVDHGFDEIMVLTKEDFRTSKKEPEAELAPK